MSNTSLLSRTAWSSVASVTSAFGRLVASIVIARQLGPDAIGEFAFLSWLIEFAGLVAARGVPNTLTRYIAEASAQRNELMAAAILKWTFRRFLASILVCAICLFLYFANSTQYGITTAVLLAVLLVSQAIAGLITAYWSGKQDFSKIARFSFKSTLTLVVCQPVFTHLYGVNGAIAALALSFAVQFVLGGAFLWRGSRHSRQELPESAKGYALYSWLAAVVSAVVWTRAEIFFLNHYSTSREAGYFSVALTFASLINIAAGLLTGALMPHFTTAVANSDTKELQTSYRRMTLFVAACVFPIGIGGATVMPELLPLVFGKSFVAAVRPAQILMISGVLAFAGVGSSLIYATGRSKFIFCSSCVGALLIVSGCPFVSDHYGASGVAYVRLSVQIIMIGVGTIFIRKILNISLPYAGMARIALASLLASAVAWLVMQLHLPASAVWAVIVAIAAYPTCLKLTKPLGSEDTAAVLDNENMVPALLRLKLKWMIL